MQACYNYLKPYFIIRKESDPMANPLFQATETVDENLRLCPDALTNENQLRPLLNYSSQPFYVLQLRFIFDKVPLTTQSGQYAVGTSVTKKRKLA